MLLRFYALSHLRLAWLVLVIVPCFSFGIEARAETIRPVDGLALEASRPWQLLLEASRQQRAGATRDSVRLTLPLRNTGFSLFLDGMRSELQVDDLAVTGDVKFSGTGGGVGFFYTRLPDFLSMKSTLRLDYHREETDAQENLAVGGRQAEVEQDLINPSIGVLFSPREPLLENGLNGYFTVGLSRLRERQTLLVEGVVEPRLSTRDSSINGHLGFGVVYPLGRLHFYAALSFEEDTFVSAGVRLGLGRQGIGI